MTQNGKKINERLILERFLESIGTFTPGPASVFMDSESPDFLLGDEKPSPLGIEIVELTHAQPSKKEISLRQKESIQDHLCGLIKFRWGEAGLPIAQVYVFFLGHQFPKKHEEIQIADSILEVIWSRIPYEESESTISRDDLWQHPVLGKWIYEINISRWEGLSSTYVVSDLSAFLPPLSHDFLQASFSKKNAEVIKYRKKCKEVWLVATHQLPPISTHFSPHNSGLGDTYELEFARAFVLEVLPKKVVEIKKVSNLPVKV
jgi:hypothetical protein